MRRMFFSGFSLSAIKSLRAVTKYGLTPPKKRWFSSGVPDLKSFLGPKLKEQAAGLEKHPLLISWLENNRKIPPRLILARMMPFMIEFVMGFSDFNNWYLKRPEEETHTGCDRMINDHLFQTFFEKIFPQHFLLHLS